MLFFTSLIFEYSTFSIFNYSCFTPSNLLSDNETSEKFSAFEANKQEVSFSAKYKYQPDRTYLDNHIVNS
jgi:hypothetical protein